MKHRIVLGESAWGLACVLVAGCGNSQSDAVGVAPPIACEVSADCAQTECICGRCTEPCAASSGQCANGLACYGLGSLGHSSACGDTLEVEGVCLKSCSTPEQCELGQQCLAGGCVSPRASPQSAVPDDTADPPEVSPAVALGAPSVGFKPLEQWQPRGTELIALGEATIAAASGCEFDPPCADLQSALHKDVCLNIQAGCGLIHVSEGTQESHAWYDNFNALPVGLSLPPVTSRDISCQAVEVSCWSCAENGPLCEEAPVPWPDLPPADMPAGCRCDADGPTRASVSLECFCSVYECPALGQLWQDTCPPPPVGFSSGFGGTMTYACGLVWFANAKVAGEKYGFDPSTGELRAAHSFTPGGPVTSPCHTFSVHAGERTACGSQLSLNNPESSFDYNPETTETCGCTIAEDDPDFSEFACQTRNWYQDLMAAVEPLSD